MGWFKEKIAKWALKKQFSQVSNDKLLVFAEEYLKRSQKESEEQLNVARRLNRANLISLQTKRLKQEMRDSLEDEEDEDDESDESDEENYADKLVRGVLENVVKQITPSASTPESKKYLEIWDKLSDEEKEVFKEKFSGMGIGN